MKKYALFIDGGHSKRLHRRLRIWKGKISPGGLISWRFPNPADGGRPPFEIYTLAKESSEFEDLGIYEALGILKKN